MEKVHALSAWHYYLGEWAHRPEEIKREVQLVSTDDDELSLIREAILKANCNRFSNPWEALAQAMVEQEGWIDRLGMAMDFCNEYDRKQNKKVL